MYFRAFLLELLYSDTPLMPPREEIGWWADSKPGRAGRIEICPFEQVSARSVLYSGRFQVVRSVLKGVLGIP